MPERFVVPQFIEVEPKVFGPITARQFVILLVSALIMFIEYQLFDFTLFIITAVITGILTLVIGFVKINGQAFHFFLLNILLTFRRPSLRVWQKTVVKKGTFKEKKKKGKEEPPKKMTKPKVMTTKGKSLSEITLIVNTGGYYKGE